MPGGRGNIKPEDGKQFSSTRQPKNRGRKKKIYTILKEKGYSGEDIKTAFGEMAWYTLKELKEVHADEKKPVIMRIVANQLFQALKKADWHKIKEILEHVIGKPTQKKVLEGELELSLKQIKGMTVK
jgi:predicted ArsR family transcriptional regulator